MEGVVVAIHDAIINPYSHPRHEAREFHFRNICGVADPAWSGIAEVSHDRFRA